MLVTGIFSSFKSIFKILYSRGYEKLGIIGKINKKKKKKKTVIVQSFAISLHLGSKSY